MADEKNIHEAILAVMKEVGYVQKKKSAGLNYSYAGEAALIEAVRPSMIEHGIYMHLQGITKINRENYVTAKGTAMANTMIQTVVRFEHAPSATFIDVVAIGEGADSGDKSANKASTGAYKYAIRQTFCIETGDDPDKYSSDEQARATKPMSTSTRIKADQDSVEDQSQDPEESTGHTTGDPDKDFPPVKFSVKAIRESATHVGNIAKDSGKIVPDVIAFLKTLDTTQEYSIKGISEMLNPKEKK